MATKRYRQWARPGWLVVLAFYLVGCAPSVSVNLPTSENGGSQPAGQVVAIGQTAKVVLVSGKVLAGVVTAVSPEQLTIGQPSNYGQKETVIGCGEIEEIVVAGSSVTDRHMAVLVPAATVLVTVLCVGMYESANRSW